MEQKEKETLLTLFRLYIRTFILTATNHPFFSFDVVEEVLNDVKEQVTKNQTNYGK